MYRAFYPKNHFFANFLTRTISIGSYFTLSLYCRKHHTSAVTPAGLLLVRDDDHCDDNEDYDEDDEDDEDNEDNGDGDQRRRRQVGGGSAQRS